MTCIKKSISRNPKIAILENKSCKNLNDLKLRNDEMEEQFVLKNEKRSIKLINNILKSSRNYMNHFSKTVNKSTVDIDKENPPQKNNNKKKKYVKRYKLFNISKTWIFFLYNVIDLSDEPEKCLAMFISLTLEKRFPNLNLEECLKVLKQNHFDEIKNISFILKNFLKCKDKFLNILKKKKKMQHMDYESLIIFAWGMSILSYCNLRDINYNLSTILFHILNVLNKCRYFKNAMDHYLASLNFPHSDLYNMTRNINHRRALTLSDRSFSDNYYYDYSERTKKNSNFVDCRTQDFTICRERLCGNNDENKNSNVKDEQLRVHRMNNTDFPISSLEDSSYDDCNCGGIYIESEKTKKWGKLNKIIKKNKWNLLNLTKCPNGLIYYINGKYLSRISYEVLDLEKNFEVSIFGNSCFGNNNIGLCSSFKIYEFLNKEEIKRRYKLIKNIKCKEMIGDNINMEIDNTIIEGIDIRNEFMIENIFFMYFAQSQKNNTRVIPLANDSKYKFKVYQLKFFTKYSMAENNLHGRNILFCEDGKKDECKFGEVTTPVLHLKKGNKITNANNSNEKKGEKKKDKNNHSKINLIYDRDEYGYDIYFKKISRKGDLPKIYGINVFSDNLSFACDMSSFYNLVLYPSLSIYNELIKPCGYTISAWVFFPIEKNISFSSLISGENDTHVCIFNDDLILGCIENYNKEKKGYINYHSSGYSIKKLNKGWYYLSVVGTLKGQFYFINGGFKGYHKFCSFDNIKYIGNSSLFINPFPYICFIQVSNKPLSMNDILYEYTISPSCYNFTYSYYYFYLSSFFANLLTNELKNDSITLVSDSSISANHLNNADYIHFDITENYDVHIYPYHESKRYYFSVSLNSMKNRRLYFFNSIKDQVNNLSIYLNNYVLLPENWTIFTVINLSYVNESSYHCLLGGQNGSSHIVIDGSDLSLGVLTNLEHLSNFSNSGCDFLCQQGSYNKFKNKKKFRGEKNENIINISLKENSAPKELSLERSFSNNKKNYNRNRNNKINPYMLKHKKYYGNFHSSGYNFQNMLNKNILLTSRCAKNEQTFFINTSKVGVCQSCSSPITCIGNCSSINNEYLSPFGFYKFVRIVFEYVTDEQIREYYYALNL
ncbi:conserved Plasmodium protein, unknown function [Plasmodium malariae]|uniref:Uncharacterized protein n=1 Tax=Plasmodium malariae TaxID=5858 RepID=A0A1C3KB90_PLAMA|nr:conserved Plasmodium protein, unknown function [Plasmodium malariae]